MPGALFLEGERINLRTIEESDLEFLRDGVNHPQVRTYLNIREPQNLENQKDFFENIICNSEGVHLLICKEKERLGIISLRPDEDKADKLGNIGIWVHPEHHGNGYGTEASKIITEYGFNQLNYHKIYARAYEDNKASKSIWKKLGFKEEGVLRDHAYKQGEYKDIVHYGVLRSEWQ